MGSDGVKMGSFDVEDALSKLDINEKVGLLSGIDFWHTYPVHRLGIPSIRLTDGPNGVRGTRFFQGVPAACFPCGTGLAATWDTDLIKQGGALQAEEAIAKGASVILGPTVNMQRSPLGGRGFESFSEDPCLAGSMGAATVNGIQSKGVAATIKHFACNDQEHMRMSSDSIVSQRAMREIYLMPFQIAQRDADPWCYMTAYNKINGIHCSEDAKLLQDVLRKEWGFNGMTMSDWFGTYSTTASIKAGLDLEMPGASYIRGALVKQALNCGKLLPRDLDLCVRKVLELVKRVAPLDIPEDAPEEGRDTPETAAMLRKIGSEGIVLLKNAGSVLPFKKEKTTAIIGPNALIAAISGGGSASLAPYYSISPFEGIKNQAKTVKYTLGAPGWKKTPVMSLRTKTKDGKQGMTMKVFIDPPEKAQRRQIDEIHITKSDCLLVDYKHPELPDDNLWWATLEGDFTPEETSDYEFSTSVAGTSRIFVDGEMVVDNATNQIPGDSFFGAGTREETGKLKLQEGKTYKITVTFGTAPTMTFKAGGATSFGAGGIRCGLERVIDLKTELDRAVNLAKEVDQVVLCMGLNSDWESEGYDREHMDLPAGSDELVKVVCAANPNTAVVIQSGTPVTMPWQKDSKAILQAWYGGNETGNAIADVLFGNVNPSGKLPLTMPLRNEDNPAFLNYRTERGRTLYGEDVYIGYRYYERSKRDVAFPFGHGESYTTWDVKDIAVHDSTDTITVKGKVSNTGKVDGAEVVQVYVSQQQPSINRPKKELKGFKKVFVKAGAKEAFEIKINKKYACSFWDEHRDAWIMEEDAYDVLVSTSSDDASIKGKSKVKVAETVWWNGLDGPLRKEVTRRRKLKANL